MSYASLFPLLEGNLNVNMNTGRRHTRLGFPFHKVIRMSMRISEDIIHILVSHNVFVSLLLKMILISMRIIEDN